jgi:hypothetical protein
MHEYFLATLVRDRQQRVLEQATAAREATEARKTKRAARRAARRGDVVTVRPAFVEVRELAVPRQRPTFDDAA